MGLRVTFVDDIKGRGSKIDGQISGSDIVIAKNATDPVLKVFGHEVSHWLEWVAPEEYQTLRQFVEQQGQMNVTMRLFQYRMAGVPLDYDGVLRGFVSDEVGKMIGNPTVLDEFIARNKQNRSLLQRLADALRALWQRLTGKDRQQVRSAEEALLAALKAGEKQAERLEKAGQVQDFGQQNAGVGSGVGDSISYDVNNTPFVTVEEDILDGVPRAMWAQTVSENLKEKFPDGVKVGERLIKINSQSRREMTYSEYTKWLRDNDKNTYADKFRATDNADEIILATQGYINEGLKHTRKDNIKDFARGTVLLRIGGVDYSAEVVVGTTSGGEMLLYDIVNMQKTQIKEEDGHTIQPSLSESRRSGVSVSKTSLLKTTDSVNPHYSLSGTGEASGLDVLRQLAEEMAQDPEQSGGWDALYQLAHEMGQDPGNPLGDMSNEEVIALLDEIAEGKNGEANEGLQSETVDGTIEEISEEEQAALLKYKSSESYKLNSLLRDGREPSESERQMIQALDATLPKLPAYQGKVYRRLGFDGIGGGQQVLDAFLAEHQVGSIIPYSAFTSTSKTLDGYPVEGELTVTLVIEGLTGHDTEGYGNNFEQEVIFARDTDFLVLRVEQDKNGRSTIYMKEVTENGAG